MQITSYGYKNPDTGDQAVLTNGNGWFSQINYNITRLNAHSHNGTDSALLNVGNLSGFTVLAPAGSWTGSGSGYRQSVNVPAGVNDVNNYLIKFYINTAGATFGQQLFLTYKRTGTGTTFDLYCNDFTIDVQCLFR